MGIRKIGKVYWLDIRIKGKRVRRSLHTSNRLKALHEYGKVREELFSEYLQEQIKFKDFCKKYMDWAWSSKPASAKREGQRLLKIESFFAQNGVQFLSDITPYHIEQLKAWLKDANKSRATINRYLQILRGLFYKAIDWEVYSGSNPLKKIKFYKEGQRVRPLSTQELQRILSVADAISKAPKSPLQANFYNLCVLALNTGMRKSEILNLKWKDVSPCGEITIKGKGDKIRVIPLNAIALKILQKQIQKTEYVFDIPNRHQQDLMRRTVNQIKKQTGIDFHFHLLRHYFTTRLIENGIDFVTIGSILGHSKITTSLIYSHTSAEKMKKAVDSLA